jgi:hypothetical protein
VQVVDNVLFAKSHGPVYVNVGAYIKKPSKFLKLGRFWHKKIKPDALAASGFFTKPFLLYEATNK